MKSAASTLANNGPRGDASARRLWLYGAVTIAPAAYFAWRYPLRGHTDRLSDIGKLAEYQIAELIGFCLGVGVMFVCYALAALETRRLPPRLAARPVFVCGA